MALRTLIRKEYKNKWEGRTPLTPNGVKTLIEKGIPVWVQRSEHRIYPDDQYQEAGATLVDQCQNGQVILGIKEPPISIIGPGQVHIAFSHTIKGQSYNMDLLQKILDQGATLIDYEVIKNAQHERLIAFGRYAGIAGAVDTFHVAGKKFALKGRRTVLEKVGMTHSYGTIESLRQGFEKLQPAADENIRVLITGYGNVGGGSEEVCKWLGLTQITPQQLLDGPPEGNFYCVLETPQLMRRKDGGDFDKHEYRDFGAERYESSFEDYLGKFDILLQTPYWDEKYPAQMPRDLFQRRAGDIPSVIGDISCDIEGSLACTLKESSIEEPAFTYFADDHRIEDGISWGGPSVMSIGHLPCELSIDASQHFSRILVDFMKEIVEMDLSKPFEQSGLSDVMQNATIVYKGQLTKPYQYLNDFLG